jgi:hypothetical protein
MYVGGALNRKHPQCLHHVRVRDGIEAATADNVDIYYKTYPWINKESVLMCYNQHDIQCLDIMDIKQESLLFSYDNGCGATFNKTVVQHMDDS